MFVIVFVEENMCNIHATYHALMLETADLKYVHPTNLSHLNVSYMGNELCCVQSMLLDDHTLTNPK